VQFPVLRNGEPAIATCGFAKPNDLAVLSSWARFGRTSSEQAVQDAGEFAGLACKRWRFYQRAGRFAESISAARSQIQKDRKVEMAILVIARAEWYRPHPQLGACLCRRTWSNGLCVDFLTVAPAFAGAVNRTIAGVGRGLLCFIAEFGETIRAKNIWGEATSISAPAYRHMFEQPEIDDFFRLSRKEYRRFHARVKQRWKSLTLPRM
jgi:hypothetical protein